MLHLSTLDLAKADLIIQLFANVFSQAESEQEGKIIEQLVTQLIYHTNAKDRMGFTASKNGMMIGSVIYSRLILNSQRQALLLSPLAITSKHQNQGIGQALVRFSIEQLKTMGVDWLITYGDPKFYRKCGFQPLSETDIPAPFTLSQSEGWLGQAISEHALAAVDSRTQCVAAFNDPNLW